MKLRIAIVLLLVAAACGGGATDAGTGPDGMNGELRVFAATSLTESFTELGEHLEAANADLDVVFNFAATSELVRQIREGALADVFASADETNMAKLTSDDLADAPATFARNALAIVVPAENAKRVRTLADLERNDVTVLLCASQVPCGRYADEMLRQAGVDAHVVSREDNVRAVLTKVRLGEADAGIVYVTDVPTASDVEGIRIPAADNIVADYPIAILRSTRRPEAARAFVALVRSAAGRAVLARHGFAPV